LEDLIIRAIARKLNKMENIVNAISAAITLGGYEDLNCIIFEFDHTICTENGDEITSKKALKIQEKMLEFGFEGALLGHPLDESDDKCFHFKTSYLDHFIED